MPRIHTPDPVLLALSPQQLVLVTLYGEARGEAVEGQIAVANVIKNRVNDGRWGTKYQSTLLAWAQFSCLWPTLGGLNYMRVLDFARHLGTALAPREQQLAWIAAGLLANDFMDNTLGATHYFAEGIAPPAWSLPPARLTATIGHHKFFAGVK